MRFDLPILRNHPHLSLFVTGLDLEPRQALLAGEQFLHGALFELAFFGEELLQGFDEGIRIAQRLGDGFLFGFGGREGDFTCLRVAIDSSIRVVPTSHRQPPLR